MVEETQKNETQKREVVVPGEIIVQGDDFLPGDGTKKQEEGIMALRYGLADKSDNLVRVIPLSGPYNPRAGNVVIGKVVMLTEGGWVIDIGTPKTAFLSLTEVPMYVNKNALDEVMDLGDMGIFKITGLGRLGASLSIKSGFFGKINEGIVFKINPHKVPRIIGKEGSMIKLIKERTGCKVTVGQNGVVWIKGDEIDKELFARKAVEFVADKSYIEGLTDKVEQFFKDHEIEPSETETENKENSEENKSDEEKKE